MSSYVFKGACWTCDGRLKGNLDSRCNTTEENSPMHTTNDLLLPTFESVCPINQGVKCIPVITGGWKGTSKSVKCNGHNALLTDSTAMCIRGGTVGGRIQISSGHSSVVEGGALSLDEIGIHLNSISAERDKSSKANSSQKNDEPVNEDNRHTENVESSEEAVSNEKGIEIENVSPDEYRKKRWCSGRCPEEFSQNCLFRKSPSSELKFTNSSQKLKSNLISDVRDIYYCYDNSISGISYTLEDGTTINAALAHHHLIPGNECFEKKRFDGTCRYELLIKLANLFDYDVNNTLNGILLPTYSNMTLSGIPNKDKPKLFFNAMENASKICDRLENDENEKYIGAQLHVGQHVYEARMGLLKLEHPEAIKCRSYESIVLIDYLEMLQDYYLDKYETTCYMKDFDAEKNDFHKRINYISSELRRKINAFPRDGTRLSWLDKRVYVSFPAMLYDLGISIDEYNEKYNG